MNMLNTFLDNDLGEVIIKRNNRARRLIARRKDGCVYLTVPPDYSDTTIKKLFKEIKPKIMSVEPKKPLVFNEDTTFSFATFSLQITKHALQNYYYTLKNKILYISCPEHVNILSAKEQQTIKKIIEIYLRSEARLFLPSKIGELSRKYGFTYGEVKINKSKARWGSCSSKGNINLSYFCMLLPEHLIELVLLHELCHTVEMNHGIYFWKLLDKVTDGRAKELTNELKKKQIEW